MRFGAARLLTFDHDGQTRTPTVELAHEALLRVWERLRTWVDSTREELRVQRRLGTATAEWAASHREASFLATGVRLAQFLALTEAGRMALNAPERTYLEASREAAEGQVRQERERQERELAQARALADERISAARRLRRRAILLALVALVALLAAGGAGYFGLEAQRTMKVAEAQRATAVTAGQAAEASARIARDQRATAQAERDRTSQQLRIAESRRLAFASRTLVGDAPDTALLLAYHAVRYDDNRVAVQALRDAIDRSALD